MSKRSAPSALRERARARLPPAPGAPVADTAPGRSTAPRLSRLAGAVGGHPRMAAFGLYLILGILTAGWYAIRDPTSVCACVGNADPALFMWSLGWWPHALAAGLNPLVSHAVWAPVGVNLARHTTIPAAALALSPVTLLFGPIAAYNTMSIASPVLAAFTAYLLCRRISGRELPALAGGYLFGFGPYLFAQLVGHPNLTMVFLIPVMAHLALRRAEEEISARRYVTWLAIVLAVQAGLSTEVLATAVALGLLALILARLLAPEPQRSRIGPLIAESLGAGLLAIAIAAYFLYYAFLKGGAPHESPQISDSYGLDLLNPLFPTRASWLGSHAFSKLGLSFENGNIAEADGYLSLPILLAFALWALTTRRRLLARMLGIIAGASFLAALGSHLHVAGMQTIALPYQLIRSLPVIDLITPSRIVMYTSLAVAVGVSAWLAEHPARSGRGAVRWLAFGLGAAMVFPNIGSGLWGASPPNPSLFRTTAFTHSIGRGSMVLALPFAQDDDSMLWQAESGFRFRMPEGYLGHYAPPSFGQQAIVNRLGANEPVPPRALLAFLRRYQVSEIVIDRTPGISTPYPSELTDLGLRGVRAGDALIYRVTDAMRR